MNNTDVSRRKFLSRTALTLPIAAAAIPAAMEMTSPMAAKAASVRQDIPNRALPSRIIGSASVTVSGLPTDGTSDCSAIIQAAIDGLGSSGGTVIIPFANTGGAQCVYMIDTMANVSGTAHYGILLKSKVRIQFKPGVVLQAMPNNSSRAYIMYGNQVNNVIISNGWLIGERYTHTNSGSGTDEWCHGIQLLGVSHVTLRGTMVSDCTGDGICIGNISGVGSSDVVLCDCVLTGNRRQALSITQGDNIALYDSEFSYTHGTAPQDGIDIEPQGTASVSNVTIDNCVIKGNNSDGIQINCQGTNVSNVNITNTMFSYNRWAGIATQTGSGGSIATGTLYGNAFYQNGYYGLTLTGNTTGYTIGAAASDGDYSNSFADNDNLYTSITYPNTNKTNTNGYVSGTDVNASGSGLTANTWRWNSYFTH